MFQFCHLIGFQSLGGPCFSKRTVKVLLVKFLEKSHSKKFIGDMLEYLSNIINLFGGLEFHLLEMQLLYFGNAMTKLMINNWTDA